MIAVPEPIPGPAAVDPLLPQEMARAAERAGVRKAGMRADTTFVLGVLGGAFIALGAAFSTTVVAGAAGALPFGVTRLLAGISFSLGLILVIAGGAELFTGNNLIVMAWAGRRVSTGRLLRNWSLVYAGNVVGALSTALLVYLAGHHAFGEGAVGRTALGIAAAKLELGWTRAFALGVLCNALVCLAVWLSFSARSLADRVAAVVFPITAFVAAGFEHSIANLYFLPLALMLRAWDPAATAAAAVDVGGLTWRAFLLDNLLPVTLGNVVGGAGLVALVYWFVYLRSSPGAPGKP